MNLINTVVVNRTKAPLWMDTLRGVEDIAVDANSSREFPFDIFSVLPVEYHEGFLEACAKGEFEVRVRAEAGKSPVILEVGADTYAAEEEIRQVKQQVSKELREMRVEHTKQLVDRCENCVIRKEWKAAQGKTEKPVQNAAPATSESLFSAEPAKKEAAVVQNPGILDTEKAPAPKAAAEPDKKSGGFDQWAKKAAPAATKGAAKGKK